MHRFSSWSHDPGPCPVDDTPHTACTPAAGAAGQRVTVPLPSSPARERLAQLLAERRAVPEVAPVTFTTKTYRGKRPRADRARD
jgi:hypothetical protein